jgi:MHS family proline/betaine transporter-like MFS transporter
LVYSFASARAFAGRAEEIMNTHASHAANAFPQPAQPSKATVRRIEFSSSVGNAFEWFDLLVYGYFATSIAKKFFPMQGEWLSTLRAIGTLGISFLMRPIGALAPASAATVEAARQP